MKKTISWILAALLSFSTIAFAEEEKDHISHDADGAINGYQGSAYVTIPAKIDGYTIERVGDYAFFDASIKYVFIEDGVWEVGESSFEGSTVKSVDLPASMNRIGKRAFASCTRLTELFLRGGIPTFEAEALAGTPYLVIYTPCGTDLATLTQRVATAKGDQSFDIEPLHNYEEHPTEKAADGSSVSYCKTCGARYSMYVETVQMPFVDVAADSWYYSAVKEAYTYGIISGRTDTTFDPDAGMTLAEAAKIAACIHAYQLTGSTEFPASGTRWYDPFLEYCVKTGIISDINMFNWDKAATRGEMAYLFSRADAHPYYINDVYLGDIPDVTFDTPFSYEILDLYNKGIAVGSDSQGTFYPDSGVKRCEAAAFIARILSQDMRVDFY